jgi:hypothetical protein
MIKSLNALVLNLKSEMKCINEMCKVSVLTLDFLEVISPSNESHAERKEREV